ncbi:MAG: DUF6513 domain-containing protein [Pseudomonadota bacterium]
MSKSLWAEADRLSRCIAPSFPPSNLRGRKSEFQVGWQNDQFEDPGMSERILFLTGRLAESSLNKTLESIPDRQFSFDIKVLGVSVAALMTTDLIAKRLDPFDGVDRVILPGRCRGELAILETQFGVPFERGPEELKDLPQFFGGEKYQFDLSHHDMKIFAEIVDAPQSSVSSIVSRAERYRLDGADVIDIGCLPNTPFPHLEDTIKALKHENFIVSVDSLADDDLLRGGRAGADYLFSLSERSLWIADEVDSTPILIGDTPTDLDSCIRTVEKFLPTGKAFYADPILDPIHYGFVDSINRYKGLRDRFPNIEILMGIGNLSELTHADTLGVNTMLLGIASELNITALLTTEVSRHCRSVVKELDSGRRIMFAARGESMPPRHIDEALLALHDRHPFPYSTSEINEFADAVKDTNFRIQVNEQGIHVYNRDGIRRATDPYDLFPKLNVDDDAPHAFYLGLELARAEIAWQLGKRYEQDELLSWGCVWRDEPDDLTQFSEEKSTLKARKHNYKTKRSKG